MLESNEQITGFTPEWQEGRVELVIHPSKNSDRRQKQFLFELFEFAQIDQDRCTIRQYPSGPTFVSCFVRRSSLETLYGVNPLRSAHPLTFGGLKPLRSSPIAKAPQPPVSATRSTIKVGVFDGGIDVTCPLLIGHAEEDVGLSISTPPNPAYVEHGTAVAAAVLYGPLNSFAASDVLPPPPVSVTSFRALPTSDPLDVDLYESIDVIERVVPARQDIKVYNISFGPVGQIEDDCLSRFTYSLDQLAHSHKVAFYIAVGNDGEVSGENRIQAPSDLANGCGVAAHTLDRVRAKYSCIGPGRESAKIKPDFAAFGGCDQHPIHLASTTPGEKLLNWGTSFASPIAARLGALASESFERSSALLGRALLVHTANSDDKVWNTELGHGCIRDSIDDILFCEARAVTVVFQASILPKQIIKLPIPLPLTLVLPGMVSFRWTVAALPPVDSLHPEDEAYVELDEGLGILSAHAQSLGYDGLILFLDELILWLATNSGNLDFVQREANKLVKLVESKKAERPIPIISFVARQRDLRDLIGETVSGIEQVNLSDILSHMEERFDMITLEDRNLPLIAQKRVLKTKDPERTELNDAYEDAVKLQPEVMEILLARDGNKELFKQVYPFSPALIKALIAISSALQRERTALKIMLEMLVKRRDTLFVGDIVPLGDLWDVVADGDDTFSDLLRVRFQHAKKLYTNKLLPMLEEQHSIDLEVDREKAKSDTEVARKFQAFDNDNRLIKSLLLAALVEGEETLRDMTCAKLAALNHGTVKSRFTGREYQTVKNKFQDWSGLHGEIRLSGDATNPTVSLQLVGVDTDQIIKAARAYDRPGERQLKIKSMLLKSFGMPNDLDKSLFPGYRFIWRGTQRFCDVLFENIRRTTDEALRNNGDDWKLIVDVPFDPEGKPPQEDITRIEKFKEKNESHKSIIWLPEYFSSKTQTELGQLVVIDHLLRGNNLDQHASDLSAQDRETARTILESRQNALSSKLQSIVEAAYGIRSVTHPGSLDDTYDIKDSQFNSLFPSLTLQRPVGASLGEAMEHLLFQALSHQFPKHPKFGQEIKVNKDLKDVLQICLEAAHTQDRRIFVEDSRIRKALKCVCEPLELGTMGETHFVLEDYWRTLFNKSLAASEKENPDVGDMKSWIGSDRGLPKEIENLLVLVYAEQTNRAFVRFGGNYVPKLDDMPAELELRQEVLPTEEEWQKCKRTMAEVFGYDLSRLLNASNLATLHERFHKDGPAVKKEDKGYAVQFKSDCDSLPGRLQLVLRNLGVSEQDAASCDRVKTAKAARELFEAVNGKEPTPIVKAIAGARIETSGNALARSIKTAAAVLASLMEPNRWEIFEAVSEISDKRKTDATLLINDVRECLMKDEFAIADGLAKKLSDAEGRAVKLLRPPKVDPVPDPKPEPELPKPKPGWKRLDSGTTERMSGNDLSTLAEKLAAKLKENPKRRVSVQWTLEEEAQ